MEEDDLGTMRAVSPSSSPTDYVICVRCGRPTPPGELVVVPAAAFASNADDEQMCQRCYAALIEGEQDLELNEP